jgi:hypothetical protein
MDTLILEKYQALPIDLQKEVLDFIEFLENKYQKQPEEQLSLAQKRASLFGNAKGMVTIMPGFENLPDGFDEYS